MHSEIKGQDEAGICKQCRINILVVKCMLNKNTLGVKKVRGQSEAALQTGATKNFDIS